MFLIYNYIKPRFGESVSMFGHKKKAILCVGSEELSLISFVPNKDNQPQIEGILSQKYSGYQNGEFLCVEELFPTIRRLIENFQIRFKIKIKRLTVGIPGEFSYVASKEVAMDIYKRIKPEDIEEMFFIGDTYSTKEEFINIDRASIYYKTNCNPQRLTNPIGQMCERVVGQLSYILCERYFCDIFNELATRLRTKIDYVSTIYSSVKYLNKTRGITELSSNIYLDLGYLSSTLAYSIGKGIVYTKSFSLGGGNVAGDITLVTNIPFSHAYALYKKLNLNLRPQEQQTYTLFIDNQVYSYDIRQINTIAEERVYHIANYIKRAIDSCPYEIERNIPIFIGGSFLCTIRGVKEIIESVCSRSVEVIETLLSGWEDTENFSQIAIIDSLLN